VQELLRVLFDALELELEPTPQRGVLERIYRGRWEDYIQCKACLAQSTNPSSFDDINLAIRAFDEQQTRFSSLEAALVAFLEPESLEGDNAYAEIAVCKVSRRGVPMPVGSFPTGTSARSARASGPPSRGRGSARCRRCSASGSSASTSTSPASRGSSCTTQSPSRRSST
jgi:hypothetical protein